ncbi:MAG: hypothetical protein KA978_05415 [Deltaproteobacteria bacterium]|nr:hypothetical protein [Deltaproteobacteria bacterium]
MISRHPSLRADILALLVVMLPVGACSSSTTAVPSSADASVDTPFATGPCRWSEGEMVLVAVTSAPEGRLELLDAVGTSDGAAVAWREHGLARPSDVLRVRRVRDDGSHHDWSASGRGSLRAVATLANDAPLEFSMAWDAAVDRLAMLVGGATERGPCTFAAFGAGDVQRWQAVDLTVGQGFARAGCGSLQRTATGWSLLTSQVRALWGTDLIHLGDDGRAVRSATLPMTARPPQAEVTRSAMTDGFVATWVEPAADAPGERALHLRRFDESANPRGEDRIVHRAVGTIRDVRVLETGSGLLAVWRLEGDAMPGASEVVVRPLSADGTPSGPVGQLTPYGLQTVGMHAVVRGPEVLTVTAPGAELGRAVFAALDARGVPRGDPRLPLASMQLRSLDAARVVATRRGALVFMSFTQQFAGGGIMAIPMDCRAQPP